MKKKESILYLFIIIAGLLFVPTSCVDDLLDQKPTTAVDQEGFWTTEADATDALMGAYSQIRGLFHRDYYFDAQGDYCRVLDGSGQLSTNETNISRGGAAYRLGLYFPDPIWGYGARFDNYYKFSYGGVNRANYVIENTKKLLSSSNTVSKQNLETIIGEARLLRGMIYLRLISMWGDVPYINKVIYDNSEVANVKRMPIAQIKDSIMADFTYAYQKLPDKATKQGRASKPAALAFRGKLQLYWASWNNFGWPELDTFTPSKEEANSAYRGAIEDFGHVINDYGLRLFRNGDPGEWGQMGKADVLPNYYHMFIPNTGNANEEGEFIFYFTHGGPGTSQGDPYVRDFAGRSIENSQACITPNFQLADRYQSVITGDFMEPLVPMNPTKPDARTAPNSALNPESYANRDYRMKGTMLWDYEMSVGLSALKETGWVPYIYKSWAVKVEIDGVTYTTYTTDIGKFSGYMFRKFVRNYGGAGRDEGNMNWPVIRLADVYLMYAEADNEINGPQPFAIDLVDQVRRRGNLPSLKADKTGSKEAFFDAIEQERIVELIAEGHRAFDLRRWRAIKRVWGVDVASPGITLLDTHGSKQQQFFVNPTELNFERGYIFKIPQSERDRNPNLTQNKPWL